MGEPRDSLAPLDRETLRRGVAAALAEDLGDAGDRTSDLTIPEESRSTACLVARQHLVLAGLPAAREVFEQVDPAIEFRETARDGDRLEARTTIARVHGKTRALLRGERTALNFLMRMSGIATLTAEAVAEIAGSGAKILDTRKTAPGLRLFDKYAVRMGGAENHRIGLYDAVMIKDTHLDSGVTIAEAVARVLDSGMEPERITVEVSDLRGLDAAIESGAGRALLDNMPPPELRAAVERARGRIVLEASGGLDLGRLADVAATGVDYLSLGCLTHSAPAADLAMDMEPGGRC